jgi:hypothetical protein
LTPNPILKVLSTLGSRRVRYLLIGGQACVFYGGAEFSRDTDIAVLAEPDNLGRLSSALEELQAECIAVPPFEPEYLARGHAIHFRCQHPDARGMRIDVISVMRGVAPFDQLWQRRTTAELGAGTQVEIVSLPDLVRSKKTQRDKDWPMLRRLVESSYVENRADPTPEQVLFWLHESRTPTMLFELAERYPNELASAVEQRPLLGKAQAGDEAGLAEELESEQRQQREADRSYWTPLRAELEQLRRKRRGC